MWFDGFDEDKVIEAAYKACGADPEEDDIEVDIPEPDWDWEMTDLPNDVFVEPAAGTTMMEINHDGEISLDAWEDQLISTNWVEIAKLRELDRGRRRV